MKTALPAAAGLALVALLALPPTARALESRVVTHAALQIPLLFAAGVAVGWTLAPRFGALGGWNANGIPGLLVGSSMALVWMLPRQMDASLEAPLVELAKLASLPALGGLPVGLGWRRLPALARSFVWANGVSMLAALGWLYHAAPVRLCNYYRADDQQQLGSVLLALAVALASAVALRAFTGRDGLRVQACVEILSARDQAPSTSARARALEGPPRPFRLARDLNMQEARSTERRVVCGPQETQ